MVSLLGPTVIVNSCISNSNHHIENNGFWFTYQTGPDASAHERWTIEGQFDSSDHIKGYWGYYSTGPFGEGSYSGGGGWSATPN